MPHFTAYRPIIFLENILIRDALLYELTASSACKCNN